MRGAPARALLACRRLRPRSDYEVNLGAEMESRALHDELDALRETQWGAPVQPRHEQIGVQIIRRAIEEPLRMIVQNAGAEGSIVLEKVRTADSATYGYNALTDTYEDLVQAGVIDPTKVTRMALQNAASIAGLLLTTEAMIVERKESTATTSAGGGGGMGGMY